MRSPSIVNLYACSTNQLTSTTPPGSSVTVAP